MNEHVNEDFRAQVDRLVAEGKLSPDEARALLGPNVNFEPPQPQTSQSAQAPEVPQPPEAPTPPPAPVLPAESEAVAAPVAPDLLPVPMPDEDADELPSGALSLVPADQVPPKLILQVAGYSLNVRVDDAATAPQIAMIVPTDRSIPPVRMTKVMPMARIPLIEVWRSTLMMLREVRKLSLTSDSTTHSTASAIRMP